MRSCASPTGVPAPVLPSAPGRRDRSPVERGRGLGSASLDPLAERVDDEPEQPLTLLGCRGLGAPVNPSTLVCATG